MIMLHVFTEEASAKKVFDIIIPKIISDGVSFRVYPHQGKQDLEKAIKDTVPPISNIPGSRILITRDQDTGDCKEVKQIIEEKIGLRCNCRYMIRIACKELEAWYLGDLNAIRKAFPRFRPDQYVHKSDFRNVDNITNPDKYLLRIIPEFKKRSSLPKLQVSEAIAPHLDIRKNMSKSFNHTVQAISSLIV